MRLRRIQCEKRRTVERPLNCDRTGHRTGNFRYRVYNGNSRTRSGNERKVTEVIRSGIRYGIERYVLVGKVLLKGVCIRLCRRA